MTDRFGQFEDRDDVTVLHVLNVLLRWRVVIIVLPILFGAVAAVRALTRDVTYSAVTSFVSQSQRTASPVAGLAAQFGVSLPTASANESPDFYVTLVNSLEVLRDVAAHRYSINGQPPRDLPTIWGITDPDSVMRLQKTANSLSGRILTNIASRTGIVTVRVTTESAELSRQLAIEIVSELNTFNGEKRQSQARLERQFVEGQYAASTQDLRAAEDRLESYMRANRASPPFDFDRDRLRRDVDRLTAVNTTLAQSLSQARIEEIRQSPVVSTIESPLRPLRPDGRGLTRSTLLAMLAGLIVGFAIAFVREYFANVRLKRTDAFAEYVRLKDEAMSDLKHPMGAVRRRSSSNRGDRAS
ncbi:MAG TPA: hypothetical protein VGM67_02685 [Gemmatimonadaceae bacterium]|jgi:uncharacterized protein involved in exopolysaccharide biosynthesis